MPTGARHRGAVPAIREAWRLKRGNAWSRLSFTRRARLPHSLMIAICSSRQGGWLGRIPRSRQMSAMTAPIGWRRTFAAICSGVGRCVTRALVSSAEGVAGGRGARGVRGEEAPRGATSRRSALRRSLASSALARCRPREMRARIRATSAVPKPEDGDRVGGGALADRGGEFLAVVDELADEAEQIGRAAWLGGWIRGVGRGGHEQNQNIGRWNASRNILRREAASDSPVTFVAA